MTRFGRAQETGLTVLYGNYEGIKGKPAGVGLGNFDGLHIGHMALINTLINESKLNGLNSLVYTFTKHPENILRKKLFTPLLTTVNKKIELLRETALNYLFFDEFDENFSRMMPEAFVRDILVNRLGIKLAVAGFDYRFGYKGQGEVSQLKEFGKKYGFTVTVIPPVKIEDDIVSSTLIRNSAAHGDMEKVFRLLGRHYSITGEVESGRRIGNTLGFPTANIHPEEYLLLPGYGVYLTKTLLDGKQYCSLTNIGNNPTFPGLDRRSVETHILNFSDDIYNKQIEVFFISKIRSEKRFKDREDLIRQIKKDIRMAREFFGVGDCEL